MSDTIKKWHEMQENKEINPVDVGLIAKYIFLLDFTEGKV